MYFIVCRYFYAAVKRWCGKYHISHSFLLVLHWGYFWWDIAEIISRFDFVTLETFYEFIATLTTLTHYM